MIPINLNKDCTVQGFAVCDHCGLLTKTENKRCKSCNKVTTTYADIEDIAQFVRSMKKVLKTYGLKSMFSLYGWDIEKQKAVEF